MGSRRIALLTLMLIGALLPNGGRAEVYVTCVFPTIPSVVMRYPDAVDATPSMRVDARPGVEMTVGSGWNRFESAKVDGYTFRFHPKSLTMSVSRGEEVLSSESGECITVNGPINNEPLILDTVSTTPEDTDNTPPGDVGNWDISISKSNFDDTKTVILSLPADQMVAGRYRDPGRPVLFLRCKENTSVLYIWFAGHFMSDIQGKGRVRIRLDKGEAFDQSMQASNNNEALGLWSGGSSIPLIKRIAETEKMFVRAMPHSESALEFSFTTQGLQEAIRPLREACSW